MAWCLATGACYTFWPSNVRLSPIKFRVVSTATCTMLAFPVCSLTNHVFELDWTQFRFPWTLVRQTITQPCLPFGKPPRNTSFHAEIVTVLFSCNSLFSTRVAFSKLLVPLPRPRFFAQTDRTRIDWYPQYFYVRSTSYNGAVVRENSSVMWASVHLCG